MAMKLLVVKAHKSWYFPSLNLGVVFLLGCHVWYV